jgi:drug/metabolite transporter (DMT)-like permease
VNRAILYALGSAVLFGASTPFAKRLVGEIDPLLLAGLLYLSSGVGLAGFRIVRDRGWRNSGLEPGQGRWLLAAIGAGGVAAPVLLMSGLALTSGAQASLLMNLEAVLTAVIAWVVFRESADRRVVFGMLAIVAGGLLLSWAPQTTQSRGWLGPLLVSLAMLCWAIDNNLTRHVSAADAVFVASMKGLVAGVLNTGLALALSRQMPAPEAMIAVFLVGALGYGASLVFFVLALRGLGTARTGAYYSVAPFVGAALSLLVLGESASALFWIAAGLMAVGVWLHVTEVHDHWHWHGKVHHRHPHFPDAEHRHRH